MSKVLAGSLRETFALVVGNLKNFTKISALPLLVYFLIVAFGFSRIDESIKLLAAKNLGHEGLPAGVRVDPSEYLWATLGLGLLAWVVLVWQFVRITRYLWKMENPESESSVNETKGIFSVLIYIVGILLVSLVPYFLLIAAYLLLNISVVPRDSEQNPTAVGSLILIVSFLVFVFLLAWFVSRFVIALPAVARGAKPGFFRGIWGLSKNESIGLTIRILVAPVVYAVFSGSIHLFHTIPLIDEYQARLARGDSGASLQIFSAEQLWRILPLQLLGIIFIVLLVWFTSTLLHVTHRRLAIKQLT